MSTSISPELVRAGWNVAVSLLFALGFSLMINGSLTWETQGNASALFMAGCVLQFLYVFVAVASLVMTKQMDTTASNIISRFLLLATWAVGFSLAINGTVDRNHEQRFLLFIVGVVGLGLSMIIYSFATCMLKDKQTAAKDVDAGFTQKQAEP